MPKRIALTLFLAVFAALGLVLTAFGQEDTHEAALVSQDSVRLTIFDNGTALIQDARTFELQAGLNRVEFTGVSQWGHFESVHFASLTDPGGTYAAQQVFAPEQAFDLATLLYANVGQPLGLTLKDGTAVEGVLMQFDGYSQLALRQDDNTILVLSADQIQAYRFGALPDIQTGGPTLVVLARSAQGGEQQLAVTYLTDGLGWSADYNLLLSSDNRSLDMTGWLAISNTTGAAYKNAQIALAAGDFDRLRYVTKESEALAIPATPTATYYQTPIPGESLPPARFVFELSQPVTLPKDDTARIEFLAGANADARNVFVYDASPRVFGYSGFITNPGYGLTDITTVQNYLEFSTDADEGLGTALPPGNLRIYQEDANGTPLIVGLTALPYTPEGETVQIYLENSAEITGERRQTEFQTLSNDAIQETYEIRLRNLSADAVEILVPERMSRSAAWEILGSSLPFEQPDPFGISFTVEVPSGQEASFAYTVLYTRPG